MQKYVVSKILKRGNGGINICQTCIKSVHLRDDDNLEEEVVKFFPRFCEKVNFRNAKIRVNFREYLYEGESEGDDNGCGG